MNELDRKRRLDETSSMVKTLLLGAGLLLFGLEFDLVAGVIAGPLLILAVVFVAVSDWFKVRQSPVGRGLLQVCMAVLAAAELVLFWLTPVAAGLVALAGLAYGNLPWRKPRTWWDDVEEYRLKELEEQDNKGQPSRSA